MTEFDEKQQNATPPADSAPQQPQGEEAPKTEKPCCSSSSIWKGGCLVLCVFGGLGTLAVVIVGILLVLGSLLAGSSLSDIERMAPMAAGGSRSFNEELLSGSYFSSDKIAVIDIKGVISSAPGSIYEVANSGAICDQIKAAQDDPSVKAVIINLDTPGGEVTASDDIYHQVQLLRSKFHKPAVAMMNSLAASGGYYVAVACDEIVANKLTLTGSIGVIIEGYNYAELFNKIGLKSEIYKSGAMKDMLNGSRPRAEAERVLVQKLVDNTYDEFVNVVSTGRKIPKDKLKGTELADGRVFDGKQALENKLVDKLGYFDDAVAEAAKLARTSNYKVIRYAEAFSLAKFLEGVSAKDSRAMSVSINGVNAQTPPLRKGCLYFLPTSW